MISINDITLRFGQRTLLSNASATLCRGRIIALIGRNGSGKSTLLRAMAGITRPQQGSITYDGIDIYSMPPLQKARTVAFVTTERTRVPNLRCRDLVAMGRAPYTNWIGRMQPADREIVDRSLSMVGMSSYADRTIDRMSDGETQRIMIARALAQDTPAILLDEPTSFLDLPNRYELCTLLSGIAHSENKCIFFSTHELDIAMRLCDDIAVVDTPHLVLLPADQAAASPVIERLFAIG